MRTSDDALFTPTEAAVLTRLSLKAVNNAIDKNLVPTTLRGSATMPFAYWMAAHCWRSPSNNGWRVASRAAASRV